MGGAGNGKAFVDFAGLLGDVGREICHRSLQGVDPSAAGRGRWPDRLHVATPSSAMSLIKAGRVRVLAVTPSKRMPLLPDVPMLAE